MIIPLRMRAKDGSVYRRPDAIEEALAALLALPPQDVARRSRIDDCEHSEYVPSECVLHFVRHAELSGSEDVLRDLFVVLRQRVLRAVPVPTRHIPASGKTGENSVNVEIRDVVVGKFQEMICADRALRSSDLDFYECRFNLAIDRLRATARKGVRKEASRCVTLSPDDETNEPPERIELALSAMKHSAEGVEVDFLYRSKLRAAISSLPPDERRVIDLLWEDVPIDSKDERAITIVRILGCSEKTVRNRRDRAFHKLREALNEEDA